MKVSCYLMAGAAVVSGVAGARAPIVTPAASEQAASSIPPVIRIKMLGRAQVNALVSVHPADGVMVSANGNLFDVEEGAIPMNGIGRARSIGGRTISTAARSDV